MRDYLLHVSYRYKSDLPVPLVLALHGASKVREAPSACQSRHECSIDAKRIYATGISNGAMMSYRLAPEAVTGTGAGLVSVASARRPCECKCCR
jgi:poly(3-hydroxybutyrate) depolymerase